MRIKNWLALFGSIALAEGAGILGSFFTVSAVETWYATLSKPDLSPPNWLFGPVWTTLYALMAIAAWRIYEKRKVSRRATPLLWIYAAHLAINTFWSVAFFGLHSPTLAFGMIVLLWLLIAYLAIGFYRIDRLAGILLVPYLAWVSFASYLNLSIVLLNW